MLIMGRYTKGMYKVYVKYKCSKRCLYLEKRTEIFRDPLLCAPSMEIC